MREEEKIKEDILFSPADPELKAIKLKTHNLNVDYNNTYEDETEKRAAILSEISETNSMKYKPEVLADNMVIENGK